MPVINLIIYFSGELVHDDPPTYITNIRDAQSLGAKRIYHYQAIRNASKNVEPHFVLCSFAVSEDARSLSRDLAGAESLPPAPRAITCTGQPGSSSSLSSPEESRDVKPQSSTSALAPDANLRRSLSISALERHLPCHPRLMDDDLPQGSAEEKNLVLWTDDDIDATDFKNMPDYDPNQEESVYDSTPNLETESALPMKVSFFEDISYVRRYVELPSGETSSIGDFSGKGNSCLPMITCGPLYCGRSLRPFLTRSARTGERAISRKLTYHRIITIDVANYLLLLFIPGPLAAPTSSPASSLGSTASSIHDHFLSHLSRYPYLTSHDNYFRHTGYVLQPAGRNAPS